MARAQRRQARSKFYRCARCRSPIVWNYNVCGVCGHNHKDGDTLSGQALIDRIMRDFPGTKEL